jgi:hypothetical protein
MISLCDWGLHIQSVRFDLKAYVSSATKCYQNSSVLLAKLRRHRDKNCPDCKDRAFSSLKGKLEAEPNGEISNTDNENAR